MERPWLWDGKGFFFLLWKDTAKLHNIPGSEETGQWSKSPYGQTSLPPWLYLMTEFRLLQIDISNHLDQPPSQRNNCFHGSPDKCIFIGCLISSGSSPMIWQGSLPYCGNIHTVQRKPLFLIKICHPPPPPVHSSCFSEVYSQECRGHVLLFSWNSSLWWQLAYIPLKVFAFLVSVIIPQVTWKCFSILAKLLWTIIKICGWVYWSRVFIREQCALLFAWLLLDTGRHSCLQ